MSKYKNRKTQIYIHINDLNGVDISELDQERLQVMRALMMGGYLMYDDGTDGMRIVATELGKAVLDRE